MNILQVNTTDLVGGAEKVSWELFQAYKQIGLKSWLAVGKRFSNDTDVYKVRSIEEIDSKGVKNLQKLEYLLQKKNFPLILKKIIRSTTFLSSISWHSRIRWAGIQDFHFPDSDFIPRMPPFSPDILHFHNLHGGYFQLSFLEKFSQEFPTLLTLHDEWLYTGHCAHSIECNRWKTGCGRCPDLKRYPEIHFDLTSINWHRKKDIYSKSRLYASAPCHWLINRLQDSILYPVETRVIPNGVNLDIFTDGDRSAARYRRNLSENEFIVLFIANNARRNPYKDYSTIESAIKIITTKMNKPITFIILGGEKCSEKVGDTRIEHFPFETNPSVVADFYRSANVYLHAAKADTFPSVVLEAQACGTPVIATNTGGISEQIEDGVTGFLVPGSDADAMASKLSMILEDDQLRAWMGHQAADRAKKLYDFRLQVKNYLDYYVEIIEDWNRQRAKVE
jgi:glycosyltransferase involved in cell wall biosynthesis